MYRYYKDKSFNEPLSQCNYYLATLLTRNGFIYQLEEEKFQDILFLDNCEAPGTGNKECQIYIFYLLVSLYLIVLNV